jgi:hypothetical protein
LKTIVNISKENLIKFFEESICRRLTKFHSHSDSPNQNFLEFTGKLTGNFSQIVNEIK